MKREVYVCQIADLKEEAFNIFEIENISVGLTIYDNQVVAYLNVCPHAGAPVCEGYIDHLYASEKRYETKIVSEHSILKCPWHGYEYKISTGEAIIKNERGLTRIEVLQKEEKVFLFL